MKLENVVINESSYGVCLRWETGGFRYHFWLTPPSWDKKINCIFKNPPNGIKPHDARYFPTRKLDVTAKANAAMLAEAQRIAKEQGLYEKAAEAKQQEEAEEKAKQEAAIILSNKRKAAEEMYEALMEAVLYIGPTQRPAPEELYTKITAALAKADGKE